jgi:hypothetical protein
MVAKFYSDHYPRSLLLFFKIRSRKLVSIRFFLTNFLLFRSYPVNYGQENLSVRTTRLPPAIHVESARPSLPVVQLPNSSEKVPNSTIPQEYRGSNPSDARSPSSKSSPLTYSIAPISDDTLIALTEPFLMSWCLCTSPRSEPPLDNCLPLQYANISPLTGLED